MKIVIADDLPSSAADLLREVPGWTVDARPGRPKPALLAALADADGLIVRSATTVDREVIAAAPRLRVVARAGTGVDNVDLDEASARGIVVMNAPGANSVSVAEHTFALMLALARSVATADAAMKQERWEKRSLTGAELRGKTLGVVGLGRIGQEVGQRARAFGMEVVAHDPFIAAHVAADLGITLLSIDELCARADYITLHVPATATTKGLFDAARLARCKPGVRIVNTARGELIDEAALADAIERGDVGGAGLDVFRAEPPVEWRLVQSPRVVATPHIAASTAEAQELVGLEVASSLRDYLLDGVIRNAVNFPSVPPEEFRRLQPFVGLAERLGVLLSQLATGRTEAVGVRYYGGLAEGPGELVANSVLVGLLGRILSGGISLVNARAVAAQRGIELVETRSTRPRNYTSLLSVKLHTSEGERWVEGTVFENGSPRLVLIDGVEIEAALDGTLLVIRNTDQPGVIGEVGTLLGRRGINIASFTLGRGADGAVGVVSVDPSSASRIDDAVVADVAQLGAVKHVALVRV